MENENVKVNESGSVESVFDVMKCEDNFHLFAKKYTEDKRSYKVCTKCGHIDLESFEKTLIPLSN